MNASAANADTLLRLAGAPLSRASPLAETLPPHGLGRVTNVALIILRAVDLATRLRLRTRTRPPQALFHPLTPPTQPPDAETCRVPLPSWPRPALRPWTRTFPNSRRTVMNHPG